MMSPHFHWPHWHWPERSSHRRGSPLPIVVGIIALSLAAGAVPVLDAAFASRLLELQARVSDDGAPVQPVTTDAPASAAQAMPVGLVEVPPASVDAISL